MPGQLVRKGKGYNLIYNGYRHKKDKPKNGRQYFRCVEVGCPGRCHTHVGAQGDEIPILHYIEHNHPPDRESVFSARFKDLCCAAARDSPQKSMHEVYQECCATIHDYGGMIPAFSACSSIMYRERAKTMPPVPANREQINLEGEWGETIRRERFKLHQDPNLLMFATDNNLRILADSPIILMDGTFKAAPNLFHQVYTIHGVYRGHIVPLVYSLLPNKTQDTYSNVIRILKEKMTDRNLQLDPEKIITDFEAAMLNVLNVELPNARKKGCFFHFCQAIYRNVCSIGLGGLYRENDEVSNFIQQLMALPLLRHIAIRPAFDALCAKPIVNQHGLQELIDYFEQQWMQRIPPRFWSVYGESIRTNNHVEGWHSKLSRCINRIHPGVYQLIYTLKREQANTEVTLQRARLGAAPPSRRPKYRTLDQRLENLTRAFNDGEMDSGEFLAAAAHIVHHF